MNGSAPGLALLEKLQVTLKLAIDKRFTARIMINQTKNIGRVLIFLLDKKKKKQVTGARHDRTCNLLPATTCFSQ